MVSVGEKSVSDFEHFPSAHHPPLQTPFRVYRCMDICQTINIFLHHLSWRNPWNNSLDGWSVQKQKKTLTIFLIISVFLCVSGWFYPVPSGAGGYWPLTLYFTNNHFVSNICFLFGLSFWPVQNYNFFFIYKTVVFNYILNSFRNLFSLLPVIPPILDTFRSVLTAVPVSFLTLARLYPLRRRRISSAYWVFICSSVLRYPFLRPTTPPQDR